jgi:hypothetical protein
MESFRSSFWLVFAVVMALGLLIALAMIVVMHGLNLDPIGLLIGLAAAEVTGVVFTLLAVFYYKVYVGPEGVRCYNFWGLYRTVAWDDFAAIRPVNFCGLRFLRVRSTSPGTPIWVPLFLTKPRMFEEAVIRHGGVTHPLARALDEAG